VVKRIDDVEAVRSIDLDIPISSSSCGSRRVRKSTT